MNLKRYLKMQGLITLKDLAAFGKKIGRSGEAVRAYRGGWRKPRLDIAKKIAKATKGAVRLGDWQ